MISNIIEVRSNLKNKSLKIRCILLFFLLIATLAATSAFAQKATSHPAYGGAIAKATILTGQDYFRTTHQAIKEAKESIYVAIYLINVEPSPTDNPASILLESLLNKVIDAVCNRI